MDEARMCQFLALLDEKWGGLEGAKPRLSIVRGEQYNAPRVPMARPTRDVMMARRREAIIKRRSAPG